MTASIHVGAMHTTCCRAGSHGALYSLTLTTGNGLEHSPTNKSMAWNLHFIRVRVTKATKTATKPVTMPVSAGDGG